MKKPNNKHCRDRDTVETTLETIVEHELPDTRGGGRTPLNSLQKFGERVVFSALQALKDTLSVSAVLNCGTDSRPLSSPSSHSRAQHPNKDIENRLIKLLCGMLSDEKYSLKERQIISVDRTR